MSPATILIIDDDPDLLGELAEMLRYGGYRVETCSNAGDAVSAARTSTPDIILVDILMPEMNGLQVIEQIRTDPRMTRIPLIITSGYCTESEGRKLARVNRFAGFLKKPMNPLEVINEVERHLA